MSSTHQKKNGFRVAWFIPIEMVMSGTLLNLVLLGRPWMAFISFVFGFVPVFILIEKYSPKPVYEYSQFAPAPKIEDYDLENEVSATKYENDFQQWLDGINSSFAPFQELNVLYYERKPLPLFIERPVKRIISFYHTLPSYNLEKRPNTLTEQASP